MCAFGRKSLSEVLDTRNSAFGTETRVLQLFHVEHTEMLQNTPKHRFGSNGGYWVCSAEKSHRRFRTPEPVHLAPKHEFCNFFVPNLPKRSKTLRNIISGLTEVIGCVRAKKLVGGSGPPKHFFVPNVPKRSKTLPNIVLGLTEVIGCVLAKKLVGGSGPPKQCIRTRNTSFASLSCPTY